MKKAFFWIISIVVAGIILLYLTNYEYILKGIRVVYLTGHTTAFIDDHSYFVNDTIHASAKPQPWPKHSQYNKAALTSRLAKTHKDLGTVAFVIIKDDSLWWESYASEYGPASQTNSFSMAKSITSALLGKAIREGYIKSLEQPVADFYPQYQGSTLTVGDLSSMSSGLNWDESYSNPFGMTARAYYDEDIANVILGLEVTETPGKSFNYLSGNTQLLAMVLQKAVKKQLSVYLEESFWAPMGFEEDALWQVDDSENRMVKAYCCIGSNAKDFARFGKLYKDKGNWNGEQLLDSSFVRTSLQPRFKESEQYGYGFWLSDHLGKQIFVMRGILGQYVITIPEDDLIIVRLGHHRGKRSERPFSDDFYVYVEEVYAMLQAKS